MRTRAATGLVMGLLLALGASVTGCSILTPDAAVDAAEQQWAALTPDVQEALGLHDQDEFATGNVAEIWVIRAELGLAVPAVDSTVPAAGRTARCAALARALTGTDLEAYGWLPTGDELVTAGPDTCVRGLGGGGWTQGARPSGPQGSYARHGSLELGRSAGGGRVELVGVTVDLADPSVQASSDAPAWSSTVAELDDEQFDRRLGDLSVPLPADLVVSDDQNRRLVVVVPAGTLVTATATCAATGPTSGRVAVDETGSTDLSPGTLRPDQRSDAAVDCPGTATARLLPDDRVETSAGPADVVLVDVSGVAGDASYEVQLR